MLAILSLLSCVNQAICYSYAPIARASHDRWGSMVNQHTYVCVSTYAVVDATQSVHAVFLLCQIHVAWLPTVYFISYIPSSFIGSWLIDNMGLRFGVSAQFCNFLTRSACDRSVTILRVK